MDFGAGDWRARSRSRVVLNCSNCVESTRFGEAFAQTPCSREQIEDTLEVV